MQAAEEFIPKPVEYSPEAQLMHTEALLAAAVVEYCPAPHAVQLALLAAPAASS